MSPMMDAGITGTYLCDKRTLPRVDKALCLQQCTGGGGQVYWNVHFTIRDQAQGTAV